mgnify:CR=1 FL=1
MRRVLSARSTRSVDISSRSARSGILRSVDVLPCSAPGAAELNTCAALFAFAFAFAFAPAGFAFAMYTLRNLFNQP